MTDPAPIRHTADTINDNDLDQLYADLDRARSEANAWGEAESADVAAGSYAGRVEELQTALTEVLAWLYPITRAMDRSVIAYQTVNGIPPTTYDRWQAALNPPRPAATEATEPGTEEQPLAVPRDTATALYRALGQLLGDEGALAVGRVRTLHRQEYGSCAECTHESSVAYPCPTVRALDGQEQPT
jgi:hypothetical protein